MRYIYITKFLGSANIILIPLGGRFAKLTPEIIAEDMCVRGDTFGECYWVDSASECAGAIPQLINEDGERKMINDLKAMKKAAGKGVRQ